MAKLDSQSIQRTTSGAAAQALPISVDQMDTEVRMTTLARSACVVMEWTPENCPVAVAFHSNRRTEDFFGGGKDIVHGISNGLLV